MMKFTTLHSLILFCLSVSLSAKEVALTIDGKTLKGELSEVEGEKEKVVFILAGSGPTDRDGNTVGAPDRNDSLKLLSNALNKEGIPTLRIDKRGVAASVAAGPKEIDLRFSTSVNDAKSWMGFLEEEGYTSVTLIGHSEGVLVATLASDHKVVKKLVCIAGPGRPAADIIREQLKPQPKYILVEANKIMTSLEAGKTVKVVPKYMYSLFRTSIQPYLISWFKLDPAKEIAIVTQPVLIIQGTKDIQVREKDAQALNAAAKESELVIINEMTHLLKQERRNRALQLETVDKNSELSLHKDLIKPLIDFLQR